MDTQHYATRIRNLREAKAWTQDHLATVADLSLRTVQRVEMGEGASAETLAALAAAFEIDVSSLIRKEVKLKDTDDVDQSFLVRVTTGAEFFSIAGGCDAFSASHDEFSEKEEVDVVAEFLDNVRDYGDIWLDLDPGERLRTENEFSNHISELEAMGIWVFAAENRQSMKIGGKAVPWRVFHLAVLRASNSGIMRIDEAVQELLKGEKGDAS